MKDFFSWAFVSSCSGAACRSAGAPLATIAVLLFLIAAIAAVLVFRRYRPTPALARGHDHLIPATRRTYRSRRA